MKTKTKKEMVPVLDTEEKLVEYASKFMHRPVSMEELSFKPLTLETVTLICAGKTEDFMKSMQNMFNGNAFKRIEEYTPTYMGEVDGVAADVIIAWRKQDEQ
jgi:hypothetical protein